MKKLLLGIIISLTIIACPDPAYLEYTGIPDLGIRTVESAVSWVYENIEYEVTSGWSTPQEIYERGYGDCSDMTILAMYLGKDYTNKNKLYYIGAEWEFENEIIKHAWLADGYYWWDPTCYMRCNHYVNKFKIIQKIKYVDLISHVERS